MSSLVLGATGATGRLLVAQLLDRGHRVRVIVRSAESLPQPFRLYPNLEVVQASVLDLDDVELARHVEGCTAVVSCLGHTLSLKGIYGHPRRLVADATARLCKLIRSNGAGRTTRFVLMASAGCINHDRRETLSLAERWVLGLLRLAVPPHADNEQAVDYLRRHIGPFSESIEWVIVRPDTLSNEDRVTGYELHYSPARSPIFNAGKTSRINVAHFMADLVTDDPIWLSWKGHMPVIYNKSGA